MKYLSLLCCWVTTSVMMFSVAGCGGSSNSSSSSNLPQITQIVPSIAPSPDPTSVTITGKNFSSTTPVQVTFGQDTATSVTVISDTQIKAVAPAKAGGDVHVTTSNGTSPQSENDILTPYSPPIVPVTGSDS